MKFFGKSKTSITSNKFSKTILFVCVENAGRSQIAEGFLKKYAPDGFKTQSAGTKPVYQLNPIVVEAMKEVGIDISKQKSKELTDEMIQESDYVVNMGCMAEELLSYNMVTKSYRMEFRRPKKKNL